MGDPVSTALMVGGSILSVGSGIAKAKGDADAASFKGAQADAAARAGRIAAKETDTGLREELAGVIGNIRAIRAASGISSDSPTTQAIIANETAVSDRERRIRVSNIERQAASDEESAGYYRRQAPNAFATGILGSLGSGFSRFAKA